MKLQGKAYVVKHEWGNLIVIETDTNSKVPLVVCRLTGFVQDDAENLCLSLNSWRESYGVKPTVSESCEEFRRKL